jgi:hypothetical protein
MHRCRSLDPGDQLVGERVHRVHGQERGLHRARRAVRRRRGMGRAPWDEPDPPVDRYPLDRSGAPAAPFRETRRTDETQPSRVPGLRPVAPPVLDHPPPERHLADDPSGEGTESRERLGTDRGVDTAAASPLRCRGAALRTGRRVRSTRRPDLGPRQGREPELTVHLDQAPPAPGGDRLGEGRNLGAAGTEPHLAMMRLPSQSGRGRSRAEAAAPERRTAGEHRERSLPGR